MGASKLNQYSSSEKEFAKLSLALAHPARVRIMRIIESNEFIRNVDLVDLLNLSKSTIHEHIYKLKEADLIELVFLQNSYRLKLKESVSEAIGNKLIDWSA